MVRLLRSAGVQKLIVVAFEGETDSSLEGMVDELVWLRVGQLSKMIRYFKSHGVGQCIMAGRIAPKNLFDIIDSVVEDL